MSLKAGLNAFQVKDYGKALELLKPIADEGAAEAQCIIGNMYQLGLGLERNILKAVKWYKKSAEKGYGVASNNLGEILRVGEKDGMNPPRQSSVFFHEAARPHLLCVARGHVHA